MECNISCDLHIEHLNHRLKGIMTGMLCDTKAIERAAKAIGMINSICDTGVPWEGKLVKNTQENTKHYL